jgi:RNA polymerase sigma-70 factor (ECF subfamily)
MGSATMNAKPGGMEMLRITRSVGDSGMVRLKVEGRLVTATLVELEVLTAAVMAEGEPPALDISAVSYADAAGVELLCGLQERGATLFGASAFLLELIEGPRTAGDPASPSQDADLIARLRDGDGAAYEEVVRRFGGRLLATARRMLNNEDDAEDAVQEALLSAFRHIGQFAGQARLSTWLHRIVVNVVLMKMRSRRARPESSVEDLLPRFVEDGHWADRIGGDEESADALLERQESRRLVRRCIDQLPETYRTVILLRDIEELDTDEAASVLGITPNATKIRLHRARQALRALIGSALGDAEPRLAVG